MIRHHARHLAVSLLTPVTLALAGCSGVSDPTKYYVLSPVPSAPHDAAPAAVSSAGVGVGPVSVPGYLARLQIVTRGASDEVEIAMYHRWAEPLESGIAQVLAANLATQIGSERVAVFPWRGVAARALDYQVAIMVLRFDGSPGRQATLDARWRIIGRDGRELALKRSTLSEPITGEGYQPLVVGMNRLLATLAQEIATEIRSRADARVGGS